MADTPRGAAIEVARQRVIDDLCERFAQDLMPVEEFERRVDRAHTAASAKELDELLADLPKTTSNLPVAAGGRDRSRAVAAAPATQSPSRIKARDVMVGIFGGSSRKGRWSPAEKIVAVGVMGGVELDFRDAVLPPDITEITAIAVMGGIDIIVPPGVHVDTGGIAIMGAFEQKGDESVEPPPNAPVIRVSGLAMMGGVTVTTRMPGESAREARRRQKTFLKARRARLKRGDRS